MSRGEKTKTTITIPRQAVACSVQRKEKKNKKHQMDSATQSKFLLQVSLYMLVELAESILRRN